MSKEYEILTQDTVADYLAKHPAVAGRVNAAKISSVDEIGDGNLNLVFHVKDEDGGSIIVKQALPYVRMVGEGWPMTPARAEKEAHSLQVHHSLVPDLVVDVFDYDPDQYVILMEDLSDHQVWRGALNEGAVTNDVAGKLGKYVANVAFYTSVLGKNRDEVAEEIAATQNPQLCTITEDLVFTEPVFDIGRNEVLPENEKDAKALSEDPAFHQAMARAKWKFMTEAQALVHGDLHTGSVMVKLDGDKAVSVKAFDSEFAFYGPIGFDMGALVANYVFAAARAGALGDTDRLDWALDLVRLSWEEFEKEFKSLAKDNESSKLWNSAFVDALVKQIFSDTLLFGSAKMARRIVGAAKVKDIETLEPAIREKAARAVLLSSRYLASGYENIANVTDAIAGMRNILVEQLQ